MELLPGTASVRLIDKEQHPFEEKKKALEDEIRKVESKRPLEGEAKFQISGKERLALKLANLISKLNFYKLIPYPMDNC